jgi:hypothetical protein
LRISQTDSSFHAWPLERRGADATSAEQRQPAAAPKISARNHAERAVKRAKHAVKLLPAAQDMTGC